LGSGVNPQALLPKRNARGSPKEINGRHFGQV
jgi:hypothetical protein